MWACDEATPTSAVRGSRRRLRPVSTLNLCHSLATMLAGCLDDRCLFSVSVVARASAGTCDVQVGHDSWTFQQGAPTEATCLAQTNDGFLWLGGPNGLFRFDGTRFEPFSSPFGDRLLSTNLYSLFAPPSGGLWIGYTFGGFSFLDKGRVTNYSSGIGSVYGFAQDRDGIVWAGASTGLWRFDHSGWQHIEVEWNAPAGSVTRVGFDSEGVLWAWWEVLTPRKTSST
jgi:ligand-binding sensor domain-containing protein